MPVVPVPDLRYLTDAEPGIIRRRAGRSFRYVDHSGRTVRDEETLARIRALAIPPAWTEVWICAAADGHLQATGRDARGRKQYRYHADWRGFRDRVKFAHLAEFGIALPRVRRAVTHDLEQRGLGRDKVLATITRLLETTLVRVGNEEYARANDSYGLTTLRNGHVRGSEATMRLVFKGKAGTVHEVGVDDRRVARVVRQCQELPGQHLFEYFDDGGELRSVQSGDVNSYLRIVSGMDITAKDFRTWEATRLAAEILAELPPPETVRESQHAVAEMAKVVSESLRNTPAVCRRSYVHPKIIGEFERGALPMLWGRPAPRGPRGLDVSERRLLALLRTPRRQARPIEAATSEANAIVATSRSGRQRAA